MATRRDQLHSYQFMIQRVVAALVMRETDPAQSPFRRAAGAIFAGFMVAAIGVAGFMVYGLWKPGGNNTWIAAGVKKPVVLVVRETGAKYVYSGGVLHPAVNYTSAMLAAGAAGGAPQIFEISRNSLATEAAGIRRGSMIGIPDAPDSLPSKDNLVVGDWSLCTQPKVDPRTLAKKGLETMLAVGATPYDKQILGGESVLLVEDEEATDKYLIYHGHKFKLIDEETVLQALTWNAEAPLKVGAAWLTSIPDGQEIKKPAIGGEGEPAAVAQIPDAVVGEVFRVSGVAEHPYYVALKDKLARITEMQAAIQMTSREQGKPKEIISSNVGDPSTELLPKRGDTAPPESANPSLQHPNAELATCAIFGGRGEPPMLVFNGEEFIPPGVGVETSQRGEQGERLASRVVVPTGKGAIIFTGDGGSTRLCLVTDSGKYYVVSSPDVLKMLGYDLEKPDMAGKYGEMPEDLVARLPRGAALDPQDALLPVQ